MFHKDKHGKHEAGTPVPPAGFPSKGPKAPEEDATTVVPPLSVLQTDAVSPDDDAYSVLAQKRAEQKARRTRKRVIIICVIAAALVLLFVVPALLTPKVETPVTTATVTRQDFTDDATASGVLEPISSVVAAPEVDGTIDAVNVSLGSTVNAGDVLFTIKNDKLDDAVSQAELSVKSAKQTLQQAIDQSDQDYQTYLNALEQEKAAAAAAGQTGTTAGSSASYDTAAHQGAIDSAQIALEKAQQDYDEAVATAGKRTVTASMSGSIIAMNAVSGTAVSSGITAGASSSSSASTAPLVEIGDLSKMKIKVEVNEVDISKVAIDQKATVTFPAASGLTLDARVTNIATTATTSSTSTGSTGVVTYTVELVIDSPDAALKPGMTADASICTQSLPNSLTVPLNALQTDSSGATYLEVQTTDKDGATSTERHDVKVGAKNSTAAVITGDVADGDVVVIPDTASTTSATAVA